MHTAGSIRVDNLSNLELWPAIISNFLAVLGVCLGVFLVFHGLKRINDQKHSGVKLAMLGILAATIGLAMPEIINGLLHAARN